ncbi:flagellar basal body rod C-terminal domain-containing protein [Megalodesulfovibrio paquesii]
MNMDAPISALQSFSVGMQVTANNIANVNTPEFRASQIHLAEAAGSGGVAVADITQSTTNGGYVQSLQPLENPETQQMEVQWQTVPASNTDLVREMVDMISWQRGFEANIATIHTIDEMNGVVLDMVV